jgi:hypothetical protein
MGKEQKGLLSTTASIAPNLNILGTSHLHETILEYEAIFQLKPHVVALIYTIYSSRPYTHLYMNQIGIHLGNQNISSL